MVPAMTSPEAEAVEEVRLIAAVAAGERTAFRELYSRYHTPLFSLAIRFLGGSGAAEEALQDTFVKIWNHAASYDGRKSRPFTWAVTILRRTCIDHLRRNRRLPGTVPLPEDDTALANFFPGETTRQTTEANETNDRVRTALATIAPPQRTALELALFSTLTHAEIAARLSQPAGTVKTWIRRGLLELRHTLTDATS